MIGLDQKKHENMVNIITRFEEYSAICGHIVPESHSEAIRTKISKFKESHDHYHNLLKQLEECIGSYRELHDSLKKTAFPYVRKMGTQVRSRKHFK
ncbi:hypothetical protein [uncultured Flavobacterium sp.]|uniref:hypothetical protein n=1 Tax=uncultured Flavobacterium sp. TaxID=165435 RepID=UPI0025EE3BD9|nr:hypothetical protein [uncultured Flavobacterium sp.]